VFQLAAGNPVVTGTVISSTWANNTLSDIANNGLSNCITKDGQQTVTANIPFNNNRLTGVANGVAASDAATVGQIQSGSAVTLTGLSGTGDAIVANSTPAITAYSTGQAFLYIPTATNTVSNPTINISTVGAKTITQSNGIGLWASALVVGTPYVLVYDGTNFRVQSGTLGALVGAASPYGFRNRFIDGNLDSWQGGTSFNISGTGFSYTADMWVCTAGASGTATVSQGTFVAGAEPAGMETPVTNFLKFSQTVSSPNGGGIAQRIESVRNFEGRSATLSVWLWTDSGTITVPNITIGQTFGTGGSSQVNTTLTPGWTVTSTPQRFSVRLDVPSILGKTIGTNDYFVVVLNLPASVTFAVNAAQWQIEDCPSAAPSAGLPTQFEWRGYATERKIITRYFQSVPVTSDQVIVATARSTTSVLGSLYVEPMRTAAAITSPTLTGGAILIPSGSTTSISSFFSYQRAIVLVSSGTGYTAGQSGLITFTGGAFNLDARL